MNMQKFRKQLELHFQKSAKKKPFGNTSYRFVQFTETKICKTTYEAIEYEISKKTKKGSH